MLKDKFIYLSIAFLLFNSVIIQSCIDEDLSNISDNVLVRQELSLPMGPRSIKLKDFLLRDTSNVPGTFGSFYYNGYKYPLSIATFFARDYVNFNLSSSSSKVEWIKRLILRIAIENSFPTSAKVQFYLNQNSVVTDSVFLNGPVNIYAASVKPDGTLIDKSVQVYDIPFEGDRLTRLKQSELLISSAWIDMQNPQVYPIRLSAQTYIQLNLAAQMLLEYNINDVNK